VRSLHNSSNVGLRRTTARAGLEGRDVHISCGGISTRGALGVARRTMLNRHPKQTSGRAVVAFPDVYVALTVVARLGFSMSDGHYERNNQPVEKDFPALVGIEPSQNLMPGDTRRL